MTPETTVPDADALRILVIDRMPPISLVQGNALIGRHLFGRLAAMHRLTLVCPLGSDDRATVEPALRNVFEDVHLVDAPAPSALGGWVDAAMPAPLGGHRGSQQIRRVLRTLAESAPFDIVHVRQLPMAPFGIT